MSTGKVDTQYLNLHLPVFSLYDKLHGEAMGVVRRETKDEGKR